MLALLLALQDLASTPLAETPLKLLEGRLSARFPAEAKIEPRGRGIMAAPAADERETRVVWSAGARKIVVMVYEQLETAGDDLPKEVLGVVNTWSEARPLPFRVAPFALPDARLRACAVVPSTPSAEEEANFILGIFCAQQDATIQHLAFYANPEAAKDAAGCAALSRRIAESLAPGGRALALAAGRRTLHEVEGRRLTIDLPEGYVPTFQRGSDFKVTSVVRLVPLGRPRPLVGAYLGGHPRYHHERADPPVSVTEEAGKLLEKDVLWQVWTQKTDAGETRFAETILPLPESRDYLLHVFASAGDAEGLKALRAALGTLRLEAAK